MSIQCAAATIPPAFAMKPGTTGTPRKTLCEPARAIRARAEENGSAVIAAR
jgi:hypothetical protein